MKSLIFFLDLMLNAGIVGYINIYCNDITKFVECTVGKYKILDSNNKAFIHFLNLPSIICRLFAGIYIF